MKYAYNHDNNKYLIWMQTQFRKGLYPLADCMHFWFQSLFLLQVYLVPGIEKYCNHIYFIPISVIPFDI